MTKPLLALLLLGFALPLACSGEKDPEPSPLASRTGFCNSWAQAACQASVVSACDAASVEHCVASQSDFCLSVVPDSYSVVKADACIGAVKVAYSDANLTAEEIQIVRYLAGPCNQLSKGTLDVGDDCMADDVCETARGVYCIRKQGAEGGTCQEPEETAPGAACDQPDQVCDGEHYCNGENCVVFKKTNGACTADYECKPDDRCVLEADAETGACTPRLELHEVCSADDDCQSHYCVRESGATEGECASMIRLSHSEPLCDDLH